MNKLCYRDNRIYVKHITTHAEYDQLCKKYAKELNTFNTHIKNLDSDAAILKVLMDQYQLSIGDFPEIGSKSLISKILHGQRRLILDHIHALSDRFGIDPALFL